MVRLMGNENRVKLHNRSGKETGRGGPQLPAIYPGEDMYNSGMHN